MTGSSSVVISNLAYLIGAVVLAFIGGFAVWLHHRQPKSIDANVDAFQRGLKAIAPDASRPAPTRGTPAAPVDAFRARPRSTIILHTAPTEQRANPEEAGLPTPDPIAADVMQDGSYQSAAGAGDGASDRAGADTG
jgi:hypothetical protein